MSQSSMTRIDRPARKGVTARAEVVRRRRSAGLSIAQLHTEHLPDHLDPFLAFDHFEMAEPFFPPHPHAGFSAVTYMFPQSSNGFLNRDSRGDQIEIPPGALHWTGAGRGLMHEETPLRRGVVCHGLQIFVNLAASKKWMEPQVLHLDPADVPRVSGAGAEVRVVTGSHGGVSSPLRPPTDVTLLDVTLAAGATLVHEVPKGQARFAYVIDGAVDTGAAERTIRATRGTAVGYDEDGVVVEMTATNGPAHVVLAGGTPLREPVVFYGPFCMSTPDDIERAIRSYQTGAMGHLERSF
jgi:redox-sensitive bicupin YhaK (pirin superfamily)